MKQTEHEQRYERLEKRRRTNRVLNLFIAVVVILIVIFAYTLIADHARNNASEQPNQSQQSEQNGQASGNKTENPKEDTEGDDAKENNSAVEESTDEVNERVIVPTDDPNVIEAFTNPSWGPIGTSQSEPHVTQFDTSSQDWKEMVKATAYATELNESDFIVWFIGNGGAPNKAISTIKTRDNQYKYRVYIEWVEKEGWKPTLVEQLKI